MTVTSIRLFLFLVFLQSAALAQLAIKKSIVDGNGSPIVMLAGGRWDMQSFSGPALTLSRNNKVIRMEHFNVQYADEGLVLPLDYSLRKESNAIGNTLDSLGINEQIILIGWSFGGLIALDFALNNPGRIKKLVLYEPPAFWVAIAKGESPKGMEQMIRLTREFKPQASITEAQLAEFRCILNSCDTSDIRKLPQWHTWAKQKERLRGLSVVADHTDSLERLSSFAKPVLILTGRGTVEFHSRINELLEAQFPNSTLKEIAGGHSAPQDAVNEFIQAVLQFIAK